MSRATLLFWALALLPATAPRAASIEGLWLTQDADAQIEIAPCGDELCGTIRELLDPLGPDGRPWRDTENPDPRLRDRPVLGLTILSGVSASPDEKGIHRGGRIYDPKSGRTYRCKLSLADDGRLRFRGYMGWSLLGHTTRWKRVGPEEKQ